MKYEPEIKIHSADRQGAVAAFLNVLSAQKKDCMKKGLVPETHINDLGSFLHMADRTGRMGRMWVLKRKEGNSCLDSFIEVGVTPMQIQGIGIDTSKCRTILKLSMFSS